MKRLKVYKIGGGLSEFGRREDYEVGYKSETYPQEFVKDIIYKDGNYTVFFSGDNNWFKTFSGFACEYEEYGEMKTKTNESRLQ